MSISFRVTDSVSQLEKAFLEECRRVLDVAITNSFVDIKRRIGELVRQLVMNTPEYDSLLNGRLKVELGLKDSALALNQILQALSQGITIDYHGLRLSGASVVGGFNVGLVKDNFSDLIGLSYSSYTSGPNKVDWLEWLLFKGDAIVITGYEIKYTYSQTSRTHSAIMIKGTGGWRVPPQYSGTASDNFITRAFTDDSSTEKVMGRIIEDEITRRL